MPFQIVPLRAIREVHSVILYDKMEMNLHNCLLAVKSKSWTQHLFFVASGHKCGSPKSSENFVHVDSAVLTQ